jgi:hypothetical protein
MQHIRKHDNYVARVEVIDEPWYIPDFRAIRRANIRYLWPYREDCFARRQIRMIIADCRALEGDM